MHKTLWFFKKLFRLIWLFETYGTTESGLPFGGLVVKIVPRTMLQLSGEMTFLGCWAKTPLVAVSVTVDFKVFLIELVGQGVFWVQTLLFSAVWAPQTGTPSNPLLKMSENSPADLLSALPIHLPFGLQTPHSWISSGRWQIPPGWLLPAPGAGNC